MKIAENSVICTKYTLRNYTGYSLNHCCLNNVFPLANFGSLLIKFGVEYIHVQFILTRDIYKVMFGLGENMDSWFFSAAKTKNFFISLNNLGVIYYIFCLCTLI